VRGRTDSQRPAGAAGHRRRRWALQPPQAAAWLLALAALAFAAPPARAEMAVPRRDAHARAGTVAVAQADAAPKRRAAAHRVAVLPFRGRSADVLRGAVIEALEDEPAVTLVPPRTYEAERGGAPLPDGAAPVIAVGGRIRKTENNRLRAVITLVAADGSRLGRTAFDGRTLLALHEKLRWDLWDEIGPLIEAAPTGTVAAAAPPAAPASPGAAPTTPPPSEAAKPKERPRAAKPAAPDEPPRTANAGAPHVAPAAAGGAATAPDEENDREEPALGPAVAAAAPPARPAPPYAAAYAPVTLPPPPPSRRPCSILDLEAAGGVMLRRFDYRNEQSGALRGYMLQRAPVGAAQATFWPLALDGCGAASAVGLRAGYELMAPIDSHLATRSLATVDYAFQAELIARIPFGPLTVRPFAGYYERHYTVAGGVVPNMLYRALGGGVELELAVSRLFFFQVGGGARLPRQTGDLTGPAWFPNSSSMIYAARAHIGAALAPWLDLLLIAQGEYASFHFDIVPGATYPNGVADGAYDLYLQGLAAVRLHALGSVGRY
jgi:hypothetical protein